jgi:hypothetical protein
VDGARYDEAEGTAETAWLCRFENIYLKIPHVLVRD